MTLAYFPEILPDELLYSALARYHRHVGAESALSTARAVFGLTHAAIAHDLPGHLDELARRVERRRGLTADRLLDEATLFPYYAAFQPERVRGELRQALRTGAADVHTRIGVVAFHVRRPTALRFCAECHAEMLRRHGEAYWRRVHQLPGALVCPDHRRPLRESSAGTPTASRHQFLTADERSCPPDARPVCAVDDGRVLAKFVEIARASADLLQARSGPRDLGELSGEYRERLARVGLMRSPKRIDHERLPALFEAHWGAALAKLPGALRGGLPGPWLTDIVRPHRTAFHPLYHVLLRGFLDALPDGARTFRTADAAAAFGPGPWPCRNRLAGHFGERVADSLNISRGRNSMVGTIACRCGYVYWRSLSPDGRIGPPRYRCYGPLLKPALERLMGPGARLTAAARELGIDCKTVRREAASLGLETPWGCKASGKPRAAPASKPERTKAPRARRPRRRLERRFDWVAIDSEMVQLLRREAAEILAVEPPVRVTLAELQRRVARQDWLGKRRRKLPLSTAEAAALSESVADFRERRARSVARRLSQDGKTPTAWQVMRAAGLSGTELPLAESALERHLAERREAALAAATDR